MNKVFRMASLLTLALVLALVANYSSALAQRFEAYTSGIQVANLTSSEASISITAFNDDGSQSGTTLNDTIAPNGSNNYFPISNVDSNFQGSIVIASDGNVAAISNILNTAFTAGGSYVGSANGSTTVGLPILNKNNGATPSDPGFSTWYSVQNAGSDTATVNVAYSDGTAAGPFQIPAGAATLVYQDREDFHTAANFAGTVTSDQPVVAAVLQESNSIIFAYTGFTGSSLNPIFPLVNANNSGYVTGVQIQNVGDASTDVTVAYTPSVAGAACTETQTIEAGGAATFALIAFSGPEDVSFSDCARGARFVGSARVTANSSNQPLVGVGNQLLPGTNGEAYGAFDAADATNVVVLPLIQDRNGADQFYTGFSVQNVGSTAAAVNCTFTGTDYTVGSDGDLAPGAAFAPIQFGEISVGYVGSATCTADDANAQIVAVVNQLGTAAGTDQFLVYEGVAGQ